MAKYKLTYMIEAETEKAMKALDFYLKDSIFPDAYGVKQIDDGHTPYELYQREVQGFSAKDVITCAKDYDLPIPDADQIDFIMDVMEKRFDANIGMNWDIIAIYIQDYFRSEP